MSRPVNTTKGAPAKWICHNGLPIVALLNAADTSKIITKIFGTNVRLSNLHTQIIVQLYKSGGMDSVRLKTSLGYSADATTHTVDTAIYQLRKMYGHEFIVNENGVYRIGKL